jgi:hypothetical protein
VPGDREQDLIKFRILFEAFGLLDYDMVRLTARDMETAANLNILDGAPKPFDIISAGAPESGVPRSFAKEFQVSGRRVVVNVVALDSAEAQGRGIGDLFPETEGAERVNTLILADGDPAMISEVVEASAGQADCIICPSDSDEPRLLSEPAARPLVFTVGRFGRHLCRVAVRLSTQPDRATLHFEDVSVAADLPEDPALVQLYRLYQQLVKESRLLESYPRIPLPDGLKYVNSEACWHCHEYEYEKWSTKAHADAFATLRKVGSDHDPECVICHVVGMEYTSGFVTEKQTPQLMDVGCETCHGPGSEHVATAGQKEMGRPQMTCLDCHTPEHSTGYAGNEEEFMKKIVHWREP